jgi:hypothetical protein
MRPPDTLPPFSGDTPTCPKCGNTGARTRFLNHGTCEHYGIDSLVMGYQANERLHRECQRCDYAWDEATIEQQPPADTTNRGI